MGEDANGVGVVGLFQEDFVVHGEGGEGRLELVGDVGDGGFQEFFCLAFGFLAGF